MNIENIINSEKIFSVLQVAFILFMNKFTGANNY